MRRDAGINGDAQRIEQMAWMLFLKVYDAKEDDWEFDEDDYKSIIPEDCRWRNWAADKTDGSALTGDELLDFVNNKLFRTLKNLEVDTETPLKKAIIKTVFEDANNYMKDGVSMREVLNVIDSINFGDYEESHAFGDIYESILKEIQSAGSSGEFYTPRAVTHFMARMVHPKIGDHMADLACGTGGFITSWLKQLEPQVKTTKDQKAMETSFYGIEKKPFPYLLCITNMLLHKMDSPAIYHMNSLAKDVLNYTDDDKFDVILMNPPYGGSEKEGIKSHFPADLSSSETADLFMVVILYRLRKNGRCAIILPDGFLFGTTGAQLAIKKKLFAECNLHTVIRMPGSVFAPYTSITTNILFFDKTGPTKETWFYRMDMPEGYKHFNKTNPIQLEHFDPVVEWWNNRTEIADTDTETFKAKKYTAEEIAAGDYNLDLCGFPVEEKEILSPEETIKNYIEQKRLLERRLTLATDNLQSYLMGDQTVVLMNIKSISDRISILDNAFPGDMKAALLQAAMQGKLTEQLQEDGDAADLLEQIAKEKSQLIKEGKIKKEKPLPEITPDEVPFDIPENWKWVRLGSIIYNRGQKTPDADFTYIDIGSIDNKTNTLGDLNNILSPQNAPSRARKIVQPGDIIYATVRPYLHNTCIIDRDIIPEPIVSTGFAVLSVFKGIYNQYLFRCLLSPMFDAYANSNENSKGVAYPAINDNKLMAAYIPLPPLAEQKRIVEKLDKLLPLCVGLIEN